MAVIDLEINFFDGSYDKHPTKLFTPISKNNFILINYKIKNDKNSEICIIVNNDSLIPKECYVNIFNLNRKNIFKRSFLINFDEKQIHFNVPLNGKYLDLYFLDPKKYKKKGCEKQNYDDMMELSILSDSIIRESERFPHIIYDINSLNFLSQNDCRKKYCSEKKIKYCEDFHYFECNNSKDERCSSIYLDENKDKYCDVLECLDQCKIGSPDCIVRNFVSQTIFQT